MVPPWSIAQSMITAPGRIDASMSSLTSTGARPPGTRTAPITRSASRTARATAARLLASVWIRPLWIWSTQRRRSMFLSSRSTSASMPCAIHAAFQPTLPAPSTTTRRPHAGRAAEQHAAPALPPLEEVRADLRRHAPGHLAHRREQRELTAGELDRFVRHARRAGVDQRAGDLGIRGEVEVGEQHEARPEERELRRLRFLHLDHEPGAAPHIGGGVDDLGARAPVVVVDDARAGAGVVLDEHADAVVAHLEHAVGSYRDAVLVGLHLARHADDQRCRHACKRSRGYPIAGTTSRMNRSTVSGVPKSENWHTKPSTPRSTSCESAAATSSAVPAITPPHEPKRR